MMALLLLKRGRTVSTRALAYNRMKLAVRICGSALGLRLATQGTAWRCSACGTVHNSMYSTTLRTCVRSLVWTAYRSLCPLAHLCVHA